MEIDFEKKQLLIDVAEIVLKQYRIMKGEESSFISQREAYRLFGTGVVKRWVQEGLIKRKKDGSATSTVRYDRIELEALAKSSNRITYLDSEERKKKS